MQTNLLHQWTFFLGAKSGALIGSIFGPKGTLIGGIIGGIGRSAWTVIKG